jgi:acetyltransferase-like isoleucine patch superfamily enzyme
MGDEFSSITGDWDYRGLPNNVHLGKDCWLERRSSFERFRSQKQPGLILGDRVHVYTWTTFNVEFTGVVEVGEESVLVGAVFMCYERITVGRRVVVSYNVTIADCDFHPLDPDLRRQDAVANAPYGDRSHRPAMVSRPVVIDDDVQIGIGAMILKGVHLGCGARVDAGAVVTADVPPGGHVAGNPARLLTEG